MYHGKLQFTGCWKDRLAFEPLHLKLIDRQGNQVSESIRTIVVRAFERAISVVPHADIDVLLRGATRVARVISDGDALQPPEYASAVLDRMAWQSQRELLNPPHTSQLRKKHIVELDSTFIQISAVQAELEIEQMLESVDERDRKIIVMRSRGFKYEDIARELGMLVVSVRCRFHLARKRLRQLPLTRNNISTVANDRIDQLRRTAYPNPVRKGCPEPSVFSALGRREISFDDPIWNHIEHCSPCYSQFADIREALFKQDRTSGLQKVARAGLIVLLLMVVGGGLYFWQRSRSIQSRQPLVASNAGESAVLNFEDGSELRGAGTNRGAAPTSGIQHLPRNDLSLTVYLPLGSRAGEYELEILGGTGESVWHAKGLAAIKDGLTSIPVKGDLRKLAVGEYRFRFRRPDGDWHEKQVLVE